MKKTLSILLFLLLLFGLCVPVFAADDAPTSPYADSQYFEYGDYRIHYRVLEAADKKGQILMLHGFGESTYCWRELAPLLVKAGYTCVLADLPDFGYSSRETRATNRLPREDIFHALMTSLSDEAWYVAGHSMGGYVALSIAQKYPESVKNLLLYGTSGNSGAPGGVSAIAANSAVASVMGSMMETFGKSKAIVKLLLYMAIQDPAYVSGYDLEAIIAPFRIKGTGAGAIYNFAMLTNTDYSLVQKMPPILFMNGDKDKVISDDARAELRASLPKGSVDCVVKGGGHMFIENLADEAARVTLSFLANNG